ncbi:MAG: histidine kinase [Rubrivivax sp.]
MGLALLMTVLAWPLEWVFPKIFEPHVPAVVFLAPVALAALYGGLKASLLLTGLVAVCKVVLDVGLPSGSGFGEGNAMRSVAMGITGVLVSLLGHALRRSRAATTRALEDAHSNEQLLRHNQERLRRLLANEQSAEDRERRRISRELHDDLQQRLAAIAMELAAVRHELGDTNEAASQGIKRAVEMNVAAVVATRRVIAGLRPRVLDELGLPEALRELADRFGLTHGLHCTVEVRGGDVASQALSPQEADCLYRITQEALNNVEKHARASTVKIVLDLDAERTARVEITDDGVGLREADLDKAQSFGLLGMRERALDFGGSLQVQRAEPRGTLVQATIVRKV